ncbi:dodecin [Gaetbulibacter saemankumensis]|uniref:dodecin n=1 Tax=Gaetbulibacter saemankumensis TaxID=311208 RepID=UPI0003FD1EFA|nr:dodecin [Gaetbulibacter saemankumensis]
MDEHIYKKIEIVGTSDTSSDDAIQNALKRASQSINNLRWFEVIDTRGNIKNGKVDMWQVTIKVGFTMN